jgi:lysophospholipase L1-like esterase
VISGLRTLVRRFQSRGLNVLLGTLTPDSAPAYVEHRRRHVNRWIRRWHRPLLVDFARAVRSPTDPSRLATRYDSGDHVHLNAAGYYRLAKTIQFSQLRGGGCG